MSYDGTQYGIRVTHNDINSPWPERKAHTVTNAMVVNAVEMDGSNVLSYRIERRRRAPNYGIVASSSTSRRPHRRSKAA